MLKKCRIILAALFLIGITLLFLGVGHNWWGWMAKLQFLPSLLALNLWGYHFGYELLLLNGLLTFGGLFAIKSLE